MSSFLGFKPFSEAPLLLAILRRFLFTRLFLLEQRRLPRFIPIRAGAMWATLWHSITTLYPFAILSMSTSVADVRKAENDIWFHIVVAITFALDIDICDSLIEEQSLYNAC
jgi:hypothetical protein